MMAPQAVLPFAQKWFAPWPEQNILMNFVPAGMQSVTVAWACLLYELHECAFALEHEPVREQKSLWWSQELLNTQNQSARHPITQALQHLPVKFNELAQPILQVAQQAPIRAGNTRDLLSRLQALSTVIAQLEQQLFNGRGLSTPEAITAQLLLMRLPQGVQAFDHAMIPMHLLARHQCLDQINNEQVLLGDWLAELMASIPVQHSGNWFREAQTRFTRRRIRQLQTGKPPRVQFGHAWDAWRAMRSQPRA